MNQAPKRVDEVVCEIKGRVAIVRINQPKKLGALSQDLFFNLAQWLRYIDGLDDVFVTVLTGTGRFFSAGADVTVAGRDEGPKDEQYKRLLQTFAAFNMNITQAFYSHRKILVAALNGPVVGIAAAVVSLADFIYAAPHAYLLCPFTSLGLVSEGLACRAMANRLGAARGAEALLMSKRISCEELVQCGYVNKVFDVKKEESDKFLQLVLEEVDNRLGEHLVPDSLLRIKALMKAPEKDIYDSLGVKEIFSGMEVFMKGVPQAEFRKIAIASFSKQVRNQIAIQESELPGFIKSNASMQSEHEKRFTEAMASLHLNPEYSDMKIICGTKEFLLHRAVVCPQSKVLADQMKLGFKESNGIIEHKEFDEDTVARMVQYLYTQQYDVPAYPMASASTTTERKERPDVASTLPTEGFELEPLGSVESGALLEGSFTNHAPEEVNATQLSSGDASLQTPASVHDVLMMHVRVHHIANYYDIPMLKTKAVDEFCSIVWHHNYFWERSGFAFVLDEIYRANKNQDGGLRRAAVCLAKQHVEDLASDEAFMDAINDSENLGEFCSALLADMTRECRRTKELGDNINELMRKELAKVKSDFERVQHIADREYGLRERAESDLKTVREIFKKVRECKSYNCENSINVAVERSGKAGQGEYMVRCLGCHAKHTLSNYR